MAGSYKNIIISTHCLAHYNFRFILSIILVQLLGKQSTMNVKIKK